MIKLSAAQIIEATGGTAIGLEGREEQVYADFATTDSREVQTGTLFVAKPGAVTDGHRFIPMAFERGATLALVEREVLDEQGVPYPSIQVPDVVVRNIRLRRGATSLSAASSGTCCGDTISILSGADRVIFDRVSLAFSTDENADLYQARNVTIQNSIIAYGLRYSTDSDTVRDSNQHHSMGVLIGDGATNLSLINNLLAMNLNRNPRIQSGLNEVCGNVVYGAQANPITISGGQANIIGNRFDRKPHNDWNYVVATSGSARVHQSGNVLPSGGTMLASGAATQGTPYSTPSCAGKVPVALDKVGATPRDTLDAATVQHVSAGTGRLIDDPNEVGGWPTLANGTPYPDLDKDGMDDDWERANGLNPGAAADGAAIGPDGYSNLERFVTSIVTGQAPAPAPEEPEQPCN